MQRSLLVFPALAILAAAPSCWGQAVTVAVSQRLGVSVVADAGPGWCAARPGLRVASDNLETFGRPELLPALEQVGAVVARECPQALGLDLTGSVRDERVTWKASAEAKDGWTVRPVASPPVDLDALLAPPAAPGPVPTGASSAGTVHATTSPSANAAEIVAVPNADGLAVVLGGHRVALLPQPDLSHRVVVDGRTVGRGESDRPPAISDARNVGDTGYVLVSQPNMGNACPGGSYYLLVIRPRGVLKTADFGTCSEASIQVSTRGGAWVGEAPGPGAEKRTTFTVQDGKLGTQTQAAAVQAGGPPAGDVRALLAGRGAADFIRVKLADDAVRVLLPGRDYAALREMAMNGVEVEFKRVGDYLVGGGCRAHQCSFESYSVAFGPGNRAVLRWTRNGRTRVFGDPPASLRPLLLAS